MKSKLTIINGVLLPKNSIFIGWFFLCCMLFSTCSDKPNTTKIDNANLSLAKKKTVIFSLPNRDVPDDSRKSASVDDFLKIAETNLQRDFGEIHYPSVILCEDALFWHVMFDEINIEYTIDKENKKVLGPPKQLPKLKVKAETIDRLSAEQAIIAAKQSFINFSKKTGVNADELNRSYTIVCEMKDAWRIYFQDKIFWNETEKNKYPNSDLPNYLIDKKDGEVIYSSLQVE